MKKSETTSSSESESEKGEEKGKIAQQYSTESENIDVSCPFPYLPD